MVIKQEKRNRGVKYWTPKIHPLVTMLTGALKGPISDSGHRLIYLHFSKVSGCGELAWRQGPDTRAAECPFNAGCRSSS